MVTINEIEIEKGEKLHLTCENADTENLTYAWYKRLNRNVGWEQFACGKTLEVVAESQYYYCEARDTSSNNTILYNTEKEPVAVKVIVGK